MSPDDVIRLRHMAEAAESALRFCQGRTRADVDTDDMLRFALTRAGGDRRLGGKQGLNRDANADVGCGAMSRTGRAGLARTRQFRIAIIHHQKRCP